MRSDQHGESHAGETSQEPAYRAIRQAPVKLRGLRRTQWEMEVYGLSIALRPLKWPFEDAYVAVHVTHAGSTRRK